MPSGEEHQDSSFTMGEVNKEIGAEKLHKNDITGAGVTVAVIDTGVEPVVGLDGDGKLVVGPDLSFEAGLSEFHGRDTYGHGTVMASIIAGRDEDKKGFRGVAPDAQILSVKVADNTGAVDVSQVIAAVDWVVENRDSNGMNVRVINLSYRTDSAQPYGIDPLAAAVERAWHSGIVVVVSAGNDGEDAEQLGNPALDPFVIAVAARRSTSVTRLSTARSATNAALTSQLPVAESWGSRHRSRASCRSTRPRSLMAASCVAAARLRLPP